MVAASLGLEFSRPKPSGFPVWSNGSRDVQLARYGMGMRKSSLNPFWCCPFFWEEKEK